MKCVLQGYDWICNNQPLPWSLGSSEYQPRLTDDGLHVLSNLSYSSLSSKN